MTCFCTAFSRSGSVSALSQSQLWLWPPCDQHQALALPLAKELPVVIHQMKISTNTLCTFGGRFTVCRLRSAFTALLISSSITSGAAQAHLEDQAFMGHIWKRVCRGDTSGTLPTPPSFLSLFLQNSGQGVRHLALKPLFSYWLTEFKGKVTILPWL